MENRQNNIKQWEKVLSQNRAYLVSFAFRMTGSLSEAEDIVQDTFVECMDVAFDSIQNPKSWLTKVCSNKALDHLKSSYKKRETYPGTWLPDAIPESLQLWSHLNHTDSPDKNLLLAESLTTSFLLLIEKLNPEERVVYLLHEIFDYSFHEIANFLEKSEEACRKMAERARKSVISDRVSFSKSGIDAEKLIAKFFESAKQGDKTAIAELLADGSEFWSDGGGKVSASPVILKDILKIAQFFAGLGRTPLLKSEEFKLEINQVNSRPGIVISKKAPNGLWEFDTIMTFEFKDSKIARIFAQRNPDKLKALYPRGN